MEETAEKKFGVYEWTIDNFSCWNKEIHDTMMESGTRDHLARLELKRMYIETDEKLREHLAIYVRNLSRKIINGDLSLIGPDGSLIWTQQVSSEADKNVLEVYPGPKFQQVVTHIMSREALHGDKLTLRFRYQRAQNTLCRIHSTLDVKTVSLKIALTSSFLFFGPRNIGRRIIDLKWPSNDDSKNEIVDLKISEDQFSKMELYLDPLVLRENIFVRTVMSVLDNDNFVIRTEENEQVVKNDELWVFSNSIRREEVELEDKLILLRLKIVPKSTLKHLYFHSTLYAESVTEISTVNAFSNKPENAVTVLSKDFMSLHLNQDFSDIQLHCGNVAFPTHKNVLSARSPVFKRMLTSDMKETASGKVDIEDLESDTLARFLAFLYSGRVDDLEWDTASKLYYAADKYQVPTLKRACADFLCANVSLGSVCDLLTLAERHQDDRLTTVAHFFIVNNFSDVLSSSEWGSLMQRDPLLTSKTVTLFAQKKYVGSLTVQLT